jgi:hypothetical protein
MAIPLPDADMRPGSGCAPGCINAGATLYAICQLQACMQKVLLFSSSFLPNEHMSATLTKQYLTEAWVCFLILSYNFDRIMKSIYLSELYSLHVT